MLPWPTLGGVEHGTLRLVRAVASHGIESVAYCLPNAVDVRAAFVKSGCETSSYEATTPSYRRPIPWLREARRLANDMRTHRIDILHCSDLLAAYYAGLAGRLAHIPVLSHVRCRFDSISARDRTFLACVNRWIFVSRQTWLEFGYKVPPNRGFVVYDGITFPELDSEACNAAVRSELGLAPDISVIGMVARVAPAKDYETFIRAAGRLLARRPRTHFLIVGDTSSTPDYRAHFDLVQQLLAGAGLASHFTFTGHRDDVARLIAAMDLFVLCTHGEGLPLSLLEGMAQGKPVLATSVGGIPELIEHEKTGLLHARGDHETLAGQMEMLLGDRARAAVLGSTAREYVRTHFHVDRFAGQMVELYRSMLGNS